MSPEKLKQKIQEIFKLADIRDDGKRPGDIIVKNLKLYRRILAEANLGLGESYMDGWWDCKNLDVFFYKVLKTRSKSDKVKEFLKKKDLILNVLVSKFINLQRKDRAFHVGQKHYDIGNELYKMMLDKSMNYSCAYWGKGAKTLDKAQEDKLDLICKKVGLKKGMKILDIGCGWGSFLKFASEKYKVKGVGITVSKEQAKFAKENCKGLPIEIKLRNYRDLLNSNEKFDAVISVGMFEHVGAKNYKTFMKVVNKVLKDDGLFLLHTIGNANTKNSVDPWFRKYIFTNSMLPSVKQIAESSEPFFNMEDWHSFGTDYDKTLMQWNKNFNKNWNKVKKTGNYDERFYRMWNYYLLSVAGSFRAKYIHLWQVVFSKRGYDKEYRGVR